MTPQSIPVSHLFLRPDARRVDPDAVKRLASSIAEIGVLNPLRVRPAERHVNGVLAQAYEVTAGAHRLQAAIDLGLDDLPCVVASDDDLHAELAMIDENLMRAELSPADRAKQVARRKAIYEELHPETKRGGDRYQTDNLSVCSFAASTAGAIGKSERTVMRDAARGEAIAPDVLDAVSNTTLDTGAYLDRLKALSPQEQRERVQRALASADKPTARALSDAEAVEKQFSAIVSAWNRAGPEARERFKLDYIDEPIMDARYSA
jgi:ParB-like chromosome segregation protein Spo0J